MLGHPSGPKVTGLESPLHVSVPSSSAPLSSSASANGTCSPAASHFPQIPQAPVITTEAFYVDNNNPSPDNALRDPIYAGTPPAIGLLTTPPSTSYSPLSLPSARITRDPACLPDPDAIQFHQIIQAPDTPPSAFSIDFYPDLALRDPTYAGTPPATGLLTTPPSTSSSPLSLPSARTTRDPACPPDPDAIPLFQTLQATDSTSVTFSANISRTITVPALSWPDFAGPPPATCCIPAFLPVTKIRLLPQVFLSDSNSANQLTQHTVNLNSPTVPAPPAERPMILPQTRPIAPYSIPLLSSLDPTTRSHTIYRQTPSSL